MSPSRRSPSRHERSSKRRRRLKLERLEDRRLLSTDWLRSIDGAGNNEVNESWGAANTPLLRWSTARALTVLSQPWIPTKTLTQGS